MSSRSRSRVQTTVGSLLLLTPALLGCWSRHRQPAIVPSDLPRRDPLRDFQRAIFSVPRRAVPPREPTGVGLHLVPTKVLCTIRFHTTRFSHNNADLILFGGSDFGVAGFEATIWRSTDAGRVGTKVFESATGTIERVTDLEIIEDGTDQNMVASWNSESG